MKKIRMKKGRAVAATLSVTAAALFGGIATGTPASAAASCSGVCFYEGYWYSGQKSDQTKTLVSGSGQIQRFTNSHYQNGANINDSVSSVVNNTGYCLKLYYDFDFQHNVQGSDSKRGMIIGKYTSVVLDGNTDSAFNDRFSSVRRVTCDGIHGRYGNWGHLTNGHDDAWSGSTVDEFDGDLVKWNH
ncbi:peptidase inhibitor family I36 protein [Streptomyces sp. NPDC056160]|uniref:peptidase inhibitor family I36 protein n=1 Tax=Streptomyces sp. NPDC056160 TaxID=3345731 RepID=UPI0035D85B7E